MQLNSPTCITTSMTTNFLMQWIASHFKPYLWTTRSKVCKLYMIKIWVLAYVHIHVKQGLHRKNTLIPSYVALKDQPHSTSKELAWDWKVCAGQCWKRVHGYHYRLKKHYWHEEKQLATWHPAQSHAVFSGTGAPIHRHGLHSKDFSHALMVAL